MSLALNLPPHSGERIVQIDSEVFVVGFGISLLKYEYFFLFIGLLIATQFIWGNVIEPLLMGSSVALNTVTVILGLVVWGYIWGVAGMLLSVPLIVLARVILAQIPDADMLVKLMGRSELKKQKA